MITVENIDFSYQKGKKIIDNLSFHVPKGSVFGFLGANGSGKTTTIRLLVGLCKTDRGKIMINDQVLNSKFYPQYKTIGTLIEAPTFYQNLSGKQNLQLLANYYKVDNQRTNEVLEMVGLSGSGSKRVKKYSMGMKQRLGIAQSILHNPKILILDEPLNGLDPIGISEIRTLISKLKEEGNTIFVSSHLLGEIEKSCDYVCIIDHGKKLFSGKVEALQSKVTQQVSFQIKCSDAPKAANALLEKMDQHSEVMNPNTIKLDLSDTQQISDCIKTIVNQNIDLFEVVKIKNSLEDIFLKLTK